MIKSEHIEKMITHHLQKSLPHHKIRDVYFYATLPGGKFFRPGLVWSIAQDLNHDLFNKSKKDDISNHALLASSVELHHTYTLLHDDLPCMDDDKVRRGKPCTHIAFGEWQALLAGDGLLNVSYQLISKMKHPRSMDLLKFFSWACGPKGLIHGQTLDLSLEMSESFENILRTHELKTARLIQVAILGSALLSFDNKNLKLEKNLFKYSKLLGINFQLLDDLSELADHEVSEHEFQVNPWLKFPKETYRVTSGNLGQFNHIKKLIPELTNTNLVVEEYYQKMISKFELNLNAVNKHLNHEIDILPLIFLMKSFSKF